MVAPLNFHFGIRVLFGMARKNRFENLQWKYYKYWIYSLYRLCCSSPTPNNMIFGSKFGLARFLRLCVPHCANVLFNFCQYNHFESRALTEKGKKYEFRKPIHSPHTNLPLSKMNFFFENSPFFFLLAFGWLRLVAAIGKKAIGIPFSLMLQNLQMEQ